MPKMVVPSRWLKSDILASPQIWDVEKDLLDLAKDTIKVARAAQHNPVLSSDLVTKQSSGKKCKNYGRAFAATEDEPDGHIDDDEDEVFNKSTIVPAQTLDLTSCRELDGYFKCRKYGRPGQ